jgi:hypothetical protein
MSPAFAIRIVVIPPGTKLDFEEEEWRDCLVEIESGVVELQFRDDCARACQAGDLLWFVGLPIVALHNFESRPAVLVAVSRPLGNPNELVHRCKVTQFCCKVTPILE